MVTLGAAMRGGEEGHILTAAVNTSRGGSSGVGCTIHSVGLLCL